MKKLNQKETKLKYQKIKELNDSGISLIEIAKSMNLNPNGVLIQMRKRYGNAIKGNKELLFSQKQKEILFGSLLGDGYLNFRFEENDVKCNIRFTEEHGDKQFEYLKYKGEELKNHLSKIGISTRKRYDIRFKNPNYLIHTLRTKANPALIEFHNLFYIGKKKIIPKDLSLLTPLAMAIWFMDDGCKDNKTYRFSTNSFNIEDVNRIREYLSNKYAIETNINKKNEIYVLTVSAKRLTNLIKDFVIDSMKYKLQEY